MLNLVKRNNNRKKSNIQTILSEWKDLNLEDFPEIEVNKSEIEDLTKFKFKITPHEGFWKGATFDFIVNFPKEYPHEAPKVDCLTKIYHTNINFEGKICVSILREGWSPVYGISTIFHAISFLFHHPNPHDPLPNSNIPKEFEAANLLLKSKEEFQKIVTQSLMGGYIENLKRSFPKLI